TNLSLPRVENPNTTPAGTTSCKFWGLGADGTVGANKNSIKIIGDETDMYAQGYFAYDSKKSGGLTVSHLRFGDKPIKSTYYISKADFVACHNPSYVTKYDMVDDLKEGGSFLLNCPWSGEELEERLPNKMKRIIAQKKINFYTIDGIKIGKEIGLGGRINTILQSAFFTIANIIPKEDAVKYMKDAATKSYSKKGQAIVDMNHLAIERGTTDFVKIDVPESWANAEGELAKVVSTNGRDEVVEYVNTILHPVNAYKGNDLPVSAFAKHIDGTAPQGSSAYEKRGIAVDVPSWNPENCIQCNFCSYVCPHAVIRPVAMTADEAANAPEAMKTAPMTGMPELTFAITVSALDCTGCGSCAQVCPGKKGNKALEMKPIDEQRPQQEVFDYGFSLPSKPEVAAKFKETTVKGSQFNQPLLEFSGACAGCGETPYAKLATQLFGDRMFIANATGCSSIWGASAPATPYTVNKEGKGPAWHNSLFEDNAEFGYGMVLGQNAIRDRLASYVSEIAQKVEKEDVKEACENYLATITNSGANKVAANALIEKLEEISSCECEAGQLAKKTLIDKDQLAKKSMWIFGGDGWAYDIGFGGLDHVLASGKDVNIPVFDTEVYSNTGGQASKATPSGSIAQFAAAGKATNKKDLAAIAMTYGNVYVAQVAMGADYNQCIKAFVEAESYNGPSIIICYAPCINHGIKGQMTVAQAEEKKAVQSGYWHIYRYDPRLADAGKNPLTIDSKAPTLSYRDFLMGENRYNLLARANPERADMLFNMAEMQATKKLAHLQFLASQSFDDKEE
ncbi:MAG: pyruvate:ferredoxin (flavodoxin) oxidoreductase, partial [Acutalibacteraceae bacterium]|nr:pyruvate:ferredoxin (flavodoxin) oxidoreductase [Acutalibacteraceae bacterium]